MDSLYQVEGDMVMAHITFVPSEHDQEVTCEASNEALSEPIRNTIVIEMNSNSDSTIVQTFSPSYGYYESDDEYDNELVYEGDYPELNVTENDNYRLLVDGTIETAWTENKIS